MESVERKARMLKNISLIVVGAALLPGLALAAVNLKKVNIVDGSQIELLFDGKVEPSQVKTEFVRDNIQLSLTNTSVYPAKVSMVSGSELTKVFAYQYSPALVRARFTVKGDAQSFANRLQVKISGKTVTVRIAAGKGDQVLTSAASSLRTVSAPEKSVEQPAANLAKEAEQKELLERIASNEREKSAEKAAAKVAEKAESKSEVVEDRRLGSRKEPITGGKPLPSPFRSIGVMLFVLGIFGLFVMFLKKVKSGDGKSAKSARGGIGGFLNKLSGAGAAKEMIEVIATHHLAPKRSIVVVRVQDRMLVLGMTNDAVNLITEFKANEEGEAEENIGIGDFAASLKKFENEDAPIVPTAKLASKANLGDIAAAALGLAKPRPPSAPKASAAANAYQSVAQPPAAGATAAGGPTFSPALAAALKEPSVKPSIRAQIKDRVQGMKQL
jgi:flagellar biogenesis protein FliO